VYCQIEKPFEGHLSKSDAVIPRQLNKIRQREIEPAPAGGISGTEETVLGDSTCGHADAFARRWGAVDEATIKAYIESQKWDEDDQGLRIAAPAECEKSDRFATRALVARAMDRHGADFSGGFFPGESCTVASCCMIQKLPKIPRYPALLT
jgi:hypothetical protein